MSTPKARDLLQLDVIIQGQHYHEDLAAQAVIQNDVPGLNTALSEHPGRFAWWATLELLARDEMEQAVGRVKQYEGEQLTAMLDGFVARKERTPSLASLKLRIVQQPKAIVLARAARAAKLVFRRVQVGRKTTEERKDSVVNMAYLLRAEMEGKLRVGGRTVSEEARAAVERVRQTYPKPRGGA